MTSWNQCQQNIYCCANRSWPYQFPLGGKCTFSFVSESFFAWTFAYLRIRKALIVPWRNRSYRILYRLSPALHCYMLKLSFPPSWNNHSGWVIMSCLLEALVVALPAEIRFEMWLWIQDSGTAMDLQHRLTPHALPPIKICWPHHSVMACGYKLFPLRLHVRITEPNLRFSSYQAQRGGWKSLPQIRRNTSCARLWA